MLRRYLPLFLILGIVGNLCIFLLTHYKVQRDTRRRFEDYSAELNARLADFTQHTMSSIRYYFLSNQVSSSSSSSSSSSPLSFSDSDPFLQERGSWDYHYFQIGGVDFARADVRNFRVGDRFPRGGVITAIFGDGVEIDGRYFVRRENRSLRSVDRRRADRDIDIDFESLTKEKGKEILTHERGADRSR